VFSPPCDRREKKKKKKKKKKGGVVRGTTIFYHGDIYGSEGSQAIPARPSCQCRLEAKYE
jgi:hypothetical protein